MRPVIFSRHPPSHFTTLSVDGQHHLMALTKTSGESITTELDDDEMQIVQSVFDTLTALFMKRRQGIADGGFVLRPIPDKMKFFAHGDDQMNIHVFVEQFRLPLPFRMTFAGIAVTMREALKAMGVKPN